MRPAAACLIALIALFDACPGASAGGAASPEQQAGDREVTIGNHAAHAINEVYASPSSTDHWGNDQLGEQTLAPGQSFRLKLGHVRDCEFDLQVVYEDASREESKGINVCKTHAIAFDGSAAAPPPPSAEHDLTIENRAGRPIQQILISPADAADWGDDRLGRSISVGDAATVRYRGDCVADIRVVFDNRGAEERRGIDICARPHIAIQPGWTTADILPTQSVPESETVQLGIVNRSGRKVIKLFVFPDIAATGRETPGPDLLGSAGLDDGARVTIAFARPPGICRFGARAVFPGGQPEDIGPVDLCRSLDLVLPAPS
jgi:hypothetical protein